MLLRVVLCIFLARSTLCHSQASPDQAQTLERKSSNPGLRSYPGQQQVKLLYGPHLGFQYERPQMNPGYPQQQAQLPYGPRPGLPNFERPQTTPGKYVLPGYLPNGVKPGVPNLHHSIQQRPIYSPYELNLGLPHFGQPQNPGLQQQVPAAYPVPQNGCPTNTALHRLLKLLLKLLPPADSNRPEVSSYQYISALIRKILDSLKSDKSSEESNEQPKPDSSEPREMSKITIQYEFPNTKHGCPEMGHILNFLRLTYAQLGKYCDSTGTCKPPTFVYHPHDSYDNKLMYQTCSPLNPRPQHFHSSKPNDNEPKQIYFPKYPSAPLNQHQQSPNLVQFVVPYPSQPSQNQYPNTLPHRDIIMSPTFPFQPSYPDTAERLLQKEKNLQNPHNLLNPFSLNMSREGAKVNLPSPIQNTNRPPYENINIQDLFPKQDINSPPYSKPNLKDFSPTQDNNPYANLNRPSPAQFIYPPIYKRPKFFRPPPAEYITPPPYNNANSNGLSPIHTYIKNEHFYPSPINTDSNHIFSDGNTNLAVSQNNEDYVNQYKKIRESQMYQMYQEQMYKDQMQKYLAEMKQRYPSNPQLDTSNQSVNTKIVELTYALQKPQQVIKNVPVYVKYRVPYVKFLKDGFVKENSKLSKLMNKNATIVSAKILEPNETVIDEQLRVIKNINSHFDTGEILNRRSNQIKLLEEYNEFKAHYNESKSEFDKEEVQHTIYNYNPTPKKFVNVNTHAVVYPVVYPVVHTQVSPVLFNPVATYRRYNYGK